jgi:hypothetical protein
MSRCVSRNFPGICGIFRIFFVALLIYLDISGFIFAQENILKKNIPLPEGPTPIRSAQPSSPREAHLGHCRQAQQATRPPPRPTSACAPRQAHAYTPIKGGSRAPSRALDATAAALVPTPALPPCIAPVQSRPLEHRAARWSTDPPPAVR